MREIKLAVRLSHGGPPVIDNASLKEALSKEDAYEVVRRSDLFPELVRMLRKATGIIEDEYPREQWEDYHVPEMQDLIARAKKEV